MTTKPHSPPQSVVAMTLAVLALAAIPADAAPDVRRAKAEYRQSQRAYRAGQYAEAAKGFERCFQLDPRPAFLLNAAQSWRLVGERKKALVLYRRYLKIAPSSPVAGQVQQLIETLTKELGTEKTKPTAPKQVVPPKQDALVLAPEDDPVVPAAEGRPIYKKWWFWTAIAAATVTVVGISAGVAASSGPDYVKEGGLGVIRW